MQALVETQIKPFYETQRFTLFCGDCRSVLPTLDACSVDAIVTDPPAGISFMGKDWDHHKGGRDAWVAWLTEVMRECLRVLKPGGHALVWAIPRTSHWTGWAIESAGFEVRDRVSHLFGSGFPKSLDVSKAIDAAAGAEREVVGSKGGRYETPINKFAAGDSLVGGRSQSGGYNGAEITLPVTDAARRWNGWGTALKPACEDWWLCRKPLEGTVAQNVLKHGTGGLNINGCRIAGDEDGSRNRPPSRVGSATTYAQDEWTQTAIVERQDTTGLGRWPANVIHDGSDEVLAGFPETESGFKIGGQYAKEGMFAMSRDGEPCYSDKGSAARFFYCAKADQVDRNEGLDDLPIKSAGEVTDRKDGSAGLNSPRAGAGRTNGSRNVHPTVKPTELMRYLCRLITPPGGIVLDPFTGSGSTGKAAMLEGLRFIGIELSEDYCQLAQRRIEAVTKQGMLFT